MPKPLKSARLTRKVRRYFRLLEEGKLKYEKADTALEELRLLVPTNQPIMVDEIPYAVVDNFEKSNHIYRPKRVNRYEVKKMKPEEFEKATA